MSLNVGLVGNESPSHGDVLELGVADVGFRAVLSLDRLLRLRLNAPYPSKVNENQDGNEPGYASHKV